MDTWNGVTRQVLSRRPDERREVSARCWTGEGDQAGCPDGGGYPKKQRPAGKPSDKLTWGCYTRRHQSTRSLGLTPKAGCAWQARKRTKDRTLFNSKSAGVKLCGRVIVRNRVPMIMARVARSRMSAKVSCPVLNQKWGKGFPCLL